MSIPFCCIGCQSFLFVIQYLRFDFTRKQNKAQDILRLA